MKNRTSLFTIVAVLLLGAFVAHGFIPNDPDGDGVPTPDDACPAENAAGFDRDGDGCIDDAVGARHIEYWGWQDSVITYVINSSGAPGVAGTADNDAIEAAFKSWIDVPGTGLAATNGGLVGQGVASGLDHINLVTFVDATFSFGLSTLAVGLTTSFDTDTTLAGRVYRKGEIFDADMIFNPFTAFKAGGAGPGTDIQSVATHEAGHVLGLSHTAVKSSTMYYVLPKGFAARSLAQDDAGVYFKAYATDDALAGASRLGGNVTRGGNGDPIAGAIVFAISSATGDTTGCEFTLPDGSFDFAGLPNGNYYVSIFPLDGSSPIGFLQAGNINELVATTVEADFLPEWYDAAESNSDDPSDRDAVAVSAGSATTVDIITNNDGTPPVVALAQPDGVSPVAIDGVFLVSFSERIDVGTLKGAFSFRDAGNAAIGGNIAVIRDDSVIVFTPLTPLDFSSPYTLRIDTDLKDQAGNALAADFVMPVTTESEPPVSVSSLAPAKGVPGNRVVINGRGFDPGATVTFNGIPAVVLSNAPGQLLVTVPTGATSGNVVVTSDLETSNALVFTVLSESEVARGYDSGNVALPSQPNAIALLPNGSRAYIAGANGLESIVVDPGIGGYLVRNPIAHSSALQDLDVLPDGRRVYAVSPAARELVEVMTDPDAGLLFNTILSVHALNAEPRGIAVDPFGKRAFITTTAGEIQVWDVRIGSPTYQQQIGVLPAPDGMSLAGGLAITPAGDRLLALASAGELLFYALGPDTLVDRVGVTLDPRDLVIDPQGARAYVAHENGNLSVVNIEADPFFVQAIVSGGSLRGLDTTPTGRYLYASDRTIDALKIFDLDETHTTFRSVIATVPQVANPVDAVISSDGVYAFSILQGDGVTPARMTVTTIGIGPVLTSVYPTAVKPGDLVMFTGQDLAFFETQHVPFVDFNGIITGTVDWSGTTIVATVPVGFTGGPVRTLLDLAGPEPVQASNSLLLRLLPSTSTDNLRFAGSLNSHPAGVSCDYLTKALAISPYGDYLYVGCGGVNEIIVYDIRPESPDFNQPIRFFTAIASEDMAITPDGKVAILQSATADPMQCYFVDPNDPRFGQQTPAINWGSIPPVLGGHVAMSPANNYALAIDDLASRIVAIDLTGVATGGTPTAVNEDPEANPLLDVVFHPRGDIAYVSSSGSPQLIYAVDMDPLSPQVGAVVHSFDSQGSVNQLAISQDGTRLYAYTDQPSGSIDVIEYDCATPIAPFPLTACRVYNGFTPEGLSPENRFRLAPQGDFAIRTQANIGFIRYVTGCPGTPVTDFLTSDVLVDYLFTPDGSRIYASGFALGDGTPASGVYVYDFAGAEEVSIASGDNQTGVVNETLPAPIRIQVSSTSSGNIAGTAVTFETATGAFVTGNGTSSIVVVATDASGFAEATWQLGATPGPQSAVVSVPGLTGSPVTFNATALDNPETLPLTLAEVLPLGGSINVSPSTVALATFSRGVDPVSVTAGTLYLRKQSDAATVPATYGFADNHRRVSVTPGASLSLNTVYEIVVGAGVNALNGGGSLTNPSTSTFTVRATDPLTLASVWPPSALRGVAVTLAGSGFNPVPSQNTVLFNNLEAIPFEGATDFLRVLVPAGAITGTVRVVANAATAGPVNFVVLVPNQSPIDDVIAQVNTGAGTKSVAVSPDGSLCYTVGTDGDVVIPVDVDGLTTFDAIPVGDQPVAIVMHPKGNFAYVVNFESGSVSVIDTDPLSPTFNTVVTTILVGKNPSDVAISSDGDRVVVANAGSGDVSIIDGDGSSVAFHKVLATPATGAGTKSVAVSPDGTIYVGTGTGFSVINAANEVLATPATGAGTKSVKVSPDGTLLFLLTTDGTLLIIDIKDGSTSKYEVLAQVGTGAGTKSLAVSPDGTVLFLIPEVGDNVLVLSISIVPGVSAQAAASFTVATAFIDTVTVGGDPAGVAVDPSGSGQVFVTCPGTQQLIILNASDVPPGDLTAQIVVSPRTLNLQSNGKYVTGLIELSGGFFPEEIVLASIRLQDVVPIVLGSQSYGDADNDGIPDLVVKFDRALFQAILPQGEQVPVHITGIVRGREFRGDDVIRTLRPTVTHPHGGTHIPPGQATNITWTSPSGPPVASVNVDVSLDNGEHWSSVAYGVANTGSVAWSAPTGYYESCRVMVTLVGSDGVVIGQGMSQDTFMITAPVTVRLKTFDIAVEDGVAVLRWETGVEYGTAGFRVVRAASETGNFVEVTTKPVPASGKPDGDRYEYRDAGILANRDYWYKLQEVDSEGPGQEFGPYRVTYKLAYALDPNAPNPFNPTTTIRYALAADGPVQLTIFDVSGRRVRSLVNEQQKADMYRLVWDGTNDRGENVASGVYFYRLQAGKFTQTRKMTLLK